jgi:PilZ domain-containing protein
MARMTPHQRLELALGILAELPTTLELLSDDGGSITIELAGHDNEMLHALAPRSRVRLGLGLRLRTRTSEGRGYDVDTSVSELFFHSAGVAAVHLTVERVRRFNGNRATPRARVDDLAFVGVLYSSMPLEEPEFDVRMVDVSPDGMAFITDRRLAIGDLLSVMATIDRKLVRMRARVLHVADAHYGRHRIGCEVTSIQGSERAQLALKAALEEAAGSAHQRGGLPMAS